jgi:hypothetical protein
MTFSSVSCRFIPLRSKYSPPNFILKYPESFRYKRDIERKKESKSRRPDCGEVQRWTGTEDIPAEIRNFMK